MTAKRFRIAEYPSDIEDTLTDKKYTMSSYGTHMEIICDLLNVLNDENEQLKHDATVLICSNQEYRKENERLKSEINMLKITIGRNEGYINRLLNKGEWNNTSDKVEWLRNNTVWTQMPSNKRTYTRAD